jgi:hypothetical protein
MTIMFGSATFNTENIFFSFTKQAILMRGSTIQSLPHQKGFPGLTILFRNLVNNHDPSHGRPMSMNTLSITILLGSAAFNTENIFFSFTKQAILMRGSTIQSLPVHLGFPGLTILFQNLVHNHDPIHG